MSQLFVCMKDLKNVFFRVQQKLIVHLHGCQHIVHVAFYMWKNFNVFKVEKAKSDVAAMHGGK